MLLSIRLGLMGPDGAAVCASRGGGDDWSNTISFREIDSEVIDIL